MDIKKLFSERALDNEKFQSVVVEPTAEEFNTIKPFIDSFPDLISVDYVNSQFLGLLGDFLGFDYLETEDSEVQREIMKRVVEEYHKKGSIEQLYKTAARSHDDNYYLGDLTYYRGNIEEADVYITYPRDRMFRYDGSRWDSGARWQDYNRVTHGVIEIDLSKYNDRTITYLDRIIPGGIKYYINLLKDISPSGTDGNRYIVYPYEVDGYDSNIYLDVMKVMPYTPNKIFTFDNSRFDNSIFDGGVRETSDVWDEKESKAGTHAVLLPTDMHYVIEQIADSKFIFNENRLKGYLDGNIDVM